MGRAAAVWALAAIIAVANGNTDKCHTKNCDPSRKFNNIKGIKQATANGPGCTLDEKKEYTASSTCNVDCEDKKVTDTAGKTTSVSCTKGRTELPGGGFGPGTWAGKSCYLPCAKDKDVGALGGVKSLKCKDEANPGRDCSGASVVAECDPPSATKPAYLLDSSLDGVLKCSKVNDGSNWKWMWEKNPCKVVGCFKTIETAGSQVKEISDQVAVKTTTDAQKREYIPIGWAANFKCNVGYWAVEELKCMPNGLYNTKTVCQKVCETDPANAASLYQQKNWGDKSDLSPMPYAQAPTMKCSGSRNYWCDQSATVPTWKSMTNNYKSCNVSDLNPASTKTSIKISGAFWGCWVSKSQGYNLTYFPSDTKAVGMISHGEQCVTYCQNGREDESATGPWCYDGEWKNVDRAGKLQRATECRAGSGPPTPNAVQSRRPCSPPDDQGTEKALLKGYSQLLRRCWENSYKYLHGSTIEYICGTPGDMISHPALLECDDGTWKWPKVDKKTAPDCTPPPKPCPALSEDLKELNQTGWPKLAWAKTIDEKLRESLREVPLSLLKCKDDGEVFHFTGKEPKFVCGATGGSAGKWTYVDTTGNNPLACQEKCFASGCKVATKDKKEKDKLTKAGLLCDGFCNIFKTNPSTVDDMNNCNGPACSKNMCPSAKVTATLEPSKFTTTLETDRQVAPSAWIGLYKDDVALKPGSSDGVDQWVLAGFIVDVIKNNKGKKGLGELGKDGVRVKYHIEVDLADKFKGSSWKGKQLEGAVETRFSELFGKDLKVQFFPDGSNVVPEPTAIPTTDTSVCCDLKDARPAAAAAPPAAAASAALSFGAKVESLINGDRLEQPNDGAVEVMTTDQVQEVASRESRRAMDVMINRPPHPDVLPAACSNTPCTCAKFNQNGACNPDCNNEKCHWDNYNCLENCKADNLKAWAQKNQAIASETGGCVKNAKGKCMLKCDTPKGKRTYWGVTAEGIAVEGWTEATCDTTTSPYFFGRPCRPTCDFDDLETDLGTAAGAGGDLNQKDFALRIACGGNYNATSKKWDGQFSWRNAAKSSGSRMAPINTPYGSICTGAMGWQCKAKTNRPRSFANTDPKTMMKDSTPFGIICGYDTSTSKARWMFTPKAGRQSMLSRTENDPKDSPCQPKVCYVSALKTQIVGMKFESKKAGKVEATSKPVVDPTLVCSGKGDAINDKGTCSYTCIGTEKNIPWVWSGPQVWTCVIGAGGAFWKPTANPNTSGVGNCRGAPPADTSFNCTGTDDSLAGNGKSLVMETAACKVKNPKKVPGNTVCDLTCSKDNEKTKFDKDEGAKMLGGWYSCKIQEKCYQANTYKYVDKTVLNEFQQAEDKGCFKACDCASIVGSIAGAKCFQDNNKPIYWEHGTVIATTSNAVGGMKCGGKAKDDVIEFGLCWDGQLVKQKKTGATVSDLLGNWKDACPVEKTTYSQVDCDLAERPRGAYEKGARATQRWNYDTCKVPAPGKVTPGTGYAISCIGDGKYGNAGSLTKSQDSYEPQASGAQVKCFNDTLWSISGVDTEFTGTKVQVEAEIDKYCKAWVCDTAVYKQADNKALQNAADWNGKVIAKSTKEAGWKNFKCAAGYAKRWERELETVTGTTKAFGWWKPGPYCEMKGMDAAWTGHVECVPDCGGKGSSDVFSTPLLCDNTKPMSDECDEFCVSWTEFGLTKRIFQKGTTSETDKQACSAPVCNPPEGMRHSKDGKCGRPWVTELKTKVTKSFFAWNSDRPFTDGAYIEVVDGIKEPIDMTYRKDLGKPKDRFSYPTAAGYPGTMEITMNGGGAGGLGDHDWGKFTANIYLDRDRTSATFTSTVPQLCSAATCKARDEVPKKETKPLSQKCARHGCMCHMLGNGICDPQCYNKDCMADDKDGGESLDCSCKSLPSIPNLPYSNTTFTCPAYDPKTGYVAGVSAKSYDGIKWGADGNTWTKQGARCTIKCPPKSQAWWNDTKVASPYTECRFQEQLKGGFWTQPYCERDCLQPPENTPEYDITLASATFAAAWRDVPSRGLSRGGAKWTCKDAKQQPTKNAICRDGKWTNLCVAKGTAPVAADECKVADIKAGLLLGIRNTRSSRVSIAEQVKDNLGPRTWALKEITGYNEAACAKASVPLDTTCTVKACSTDYLPIGGFKCDPIDKTWVPVPETNSPMWNGEAGCYKYVDCDWAHLDWGEYKYSMALNKKDRYANGTTRTHECTSPKSTDTTPGTTDICTYNMFNPDVGRWYTGSERFTDPSDIGKTAKPTCIPACKDPPRVRGSLHPCIDNVDDAIGEGSSCSGWTCEANHVRDECTSGGPSCVTGGQESAWNIDLASAIGGVSKAETDDFGWPTQNWWKGATIRNPYCFRPCAWSSLPVLTLGSEIDKERPCEEMTKDKMWLKHGETCTLRCEKDKVYHPGAAGWDVGKGNKPICYNGAFRGPRPTCGTAAKAIGKCDKDDKKCCAASDLTEVYKERFNILECEKDWYAEGETVPVKCPGKDEPSYEAYCSGVTTGSDPKDYTKSVKGQWAWRVGPKSPFLDKVPACGKEVSGCDPMGIANAEKVTVNGKEAGKDKAGNPICAARPGERCLITCKKGFALEIDIGQGDLQKGPICETNLAKKTSDFNPKRTHQWCVEECLESSGCLAGKNFTYTPRCDGVCADAIGDYNCAGPSCAADPDPCEKNHGELTKQNVSLTSYTVYIQTDRPMTSKAWAAVSFNKAKHDEWLAAGEMGKSTEVMDKFGSKNKYEATLNFPKTQLGDRTLYIKVFADAGYQDPIINIAGTGGEIPDDTTTCPGKEDAEKALADMQSAKDTWMAVGITFIVLGVLALGFCAFAALQAKNAAGDGGASSTYTAL